MCATLIYLLFFGFVPVVNELWAFEYLQPLDNPVRSCEKEGKVYVYDSRDDRDGTTAWLSAPEDDALDLYRIR